MGALFGLLVKLLVALFAAAAAHAGQAVVDDQPSVQRTVVRTAPAQALEGAPKAECDEAAGLQTA